MIADAGRRPVAPILAAALQHSLTAVAELSADDLGRSSPCLGWTVGDVLQHLQGSFDCLSAALNFGRVELGDSPSPAAPAAAAVLATLTSSANSLDRATDRRAAARPVVVGALPLDRDQVIIVAALEAAVHGWDASAGRGRPLPIPDPLATELLRLLPGVVAARTGLFAPALTVAGAVTPSRRLLAALGRDWRFTH